MPIVHVSRSTMGVAGAAPAAGDVVGTAEAKGPDVTWVVLAFLLIIGGAFAAWGLYEGIEPDPFEPAAGFTIFGPLYILAQAIERLLEPFSKYLATANANGQTTTRPEAERARNHAFTLLLQTPNEATATRAAEAEALVDRIKRNTGVVAWGLASLLAMLACGAFGITLLAAIGFDAPPFWDIGITGLAVGSGTKPLHDLISNLQKSKEQKTTPPGVVSTE